MERNVSYEDKREESMEQSGKLCTRGSTYGYGICSDSAGRGAGGREEVQEHRQDDVNH